MAKAFGYSRRVKKPEGEHFSLGVVILAAGASRRMGEPKLLLPWGGTSVLGHLLQRWKTLQAAQIAVVCAAGAQPLAGELERLGFPGENRILNAVPNEGMFSSILCAAGWNGWNPELTHWLISLGDQPHLGEGTLRELLDFGARNPDKICQPMRNGRRKHPVLLPGRFFAELKKTSARDLKVFLVENAKDLSGFESDDEGLDLDMDTPEDYERVKRMVFGGIFGGTSSTSP
jgi:molybdenum cofactor cytidylyltransferase